MKTANRSSKLHKFQASMMTLVLTALPIGLAWGANGQPAEHRPIWYEGTEVTGLRMYSDQAVQHLPTNMPEHLLQPWYFIVTPGPGNNQNPVIGVIPGDIGYTGWWRWSALMDFSGRDLATDPYTSIGEVGAAICHIPDFPENIQACVLNGTPLIDVTGRGGATDFTVHIPVLPTPPEPAVCQ